MGFSVELQNTSIVIPTYGREEVLVDTVTSLLKLDKRAGEIIVVDQTPEHRPETMAVLQRLQTGGSVRWIRLEVPSIPRAMNTGLLAASCPVVLFLDDDIIPDPELLAAHEAAWAEAGQEGAWCVAGQVLQPGEEPINPDTWRHSWFPFNSDRRQWIRDVMAGNLSVDRRKALAIGGFDENFVGAAYRFESEFAGRVLRAGGKILFEPRAGIRHLRAEQGGTRSTGSHITSASPLHGVGDYYFALRQGLCPATIVYMLRRPFREVRARYYLKHPWWIPVKFFAEIRSLLLAIRLHRQGPRYVQDGQGRTHYD